MISPVFFYDCDFFRLIDISLKGVSKVKTMPKIPYAVIRFLDTTTYKQEFYFDTMDLYDN
jgi:hypothetical protein